MLASSVLSAQRSVLIAQKSHGLVATRTSAHLGPKSSTRCLKNKDRSLLRLFSTQAVSQATFEARNHNIDTKKMVWSSAKSKLRQPGSTKTVAQKSSPLQKKIESAHTKMRHSIVLDLWKARVPEEVTSKTRVLVLKTLMLTNKKQEALDFAQEICTHLHQDDPISQGFLVSEAMACFRVLNSPSQAEVLMDRVRELNINLGTAIPTQYISAIATSNDLALIDMRFKELVGAHPPLWQDDHFLASVIHAQCQSGIDTIGLLALISYMEDHKAGFNVASLSELCKALSLDLLPLSHLEAFHQLHPLPFTSSASIYLLEGLYNRQLYSDALRWFEVLLPPTDATWDARKIYYKWALRILAQVRRVDQFLELYEEAHRIGGFRAQTFLVEASKDPKFGLNVMSYVLDRLEGLSVQPKPLSNESRSTIIFPLTEMHATQCYQLLRGSAITGQWESTQLLLDHIISHPTKFQTLTFDFLDTFKRIKNSHGDTHPELESLLSTQIEGHRLAYAQSEQLFAKLRDAVVILRSQAGKQQQTSQ